MQLAHSGVKILADPWFEGTLTFAEQTWFFEGVKPGLRDKGVDVPAVLDGVEFILLSQSLDDHTHRPTLRALPKDIPIVAEPAAAAVARDLGYKTVYALDHGKSVRSRTPHSSAVCMICRCCQGIQHVPCTRMYVINIKAHSIVYGSMTLPPECRRRCAMASSQ